jgi:hypothetical protein
VALFALIVIVACLNRETGLALPLAGLLLARCHGRSLRPMLAMLALGIVVVALVRVVQGDAVRVWTLDRVLARNLVTLHESVPLLALLLGAGWWRLRAWRRAPRTLLALLPVVAVYALMVAAFGLWRELSRLFLPTLPIVLALALSPRLNSVTCAAADSVS